MKKKLLIIGLSVLMLFSLVGCNQGNADESGSGSKQSGKVNLLFYDSEHKMFHTEKITINIEEISLLSPNEPTNLEGKPVLVIQYMISVSYTHLDVYKRQSMRYPSQRFSMTNCLNT